MASRETAGTVIPIRELTTLEEFRDAVGLQRLIWGWEDLDLLPVRFFVVASKVGGQVLGAFDGPLMVGFCLSIPGVKPSGKVYLHSHMLGVLPEYRDVGAGRRMKFAQREGALARGIDLIEWTFDPLDIKNAYFNIERLGAIVRRFVPNQYGNSTSRLHGGLPTDRCMAEWHLTRERQAKTAPAARISVPANMTRLKRDNPEQAREIQARVAEEFLEYLSQDLSVTGFERSHDAGVYLFTPWPSK